MKILLFGVSNVGKSTTGKLLANRLGFKFYDLDEEVKAKLDITLEEFVQTGNLRWRDQYRTNIIKDLVSFNEDMVVAITPISYLGNLRETINDKEIIAIELYDTPENIFSRLVFSDENDVIYTDDQYKNKHKAYYLNEIQEDLNWYGKVNAKLGIRNRIFIHNDTPEIVVDRMITELNLEK